MTEEGKGKRPGVIERIEARADPGAPAVSEQLYHTDTVKWADQQARALRAAAHARTNLAIDWENVAEEIEALARSERRELRNRIRTVLIHLIRLQASPAVAPRNGWRATVREQRDEIDDILRDNPSLRPTVAEVVAEELETAKNSVRASLDDYGETSRIDMDSVTFTEEQFFGPWLP
jgi:hypothetical protein